MAKFIDSDFFRGVLNRMVEHLEAVDATRDAETIKSVIRFLKVMEEFHAVEVVHGRWVAVPSSDMMTGKAYKCSECGKMRYGSFMPNYCQNCGADMRGDSNDST